MATPEGKIKALVRRKLDKAFPKAWRFMPVQMGYGAPALDFIYCIDGLFVSIETKVPGKDPTPRQQATIEAIVEAGGEVYVVRDAKDVDETIEAIRYALINRG